MSNFQRKRLELPTGELKLSDGRRLQPIIGYDSRRFALDKTTAAATLESRAWRHIETGLIVSAATHNDGHWGQLLRVTVSYPHRDPTWDEIKRISTLFYPADAEAFVDLPRETVHPHAIHIWQMLELWRG